MAKGTIMAMMVTAVSLSLIFAGCGTSKCDKTTKKAKTVEVKSPDGKVLAKVFVDQGGQLSFNISRQGAAIIESSPMGVKVNGVDLGNGINIGRPKQESVNKSYPWRGVHSIAVNHYNEAIIPVVHTADNTAYSVELRAFNDGVAFRYVMPGKGKRTVNGERTAWVLPAGSYIWHHNNTMQYEGIHEKHKPEEIAVETVMAMPLTIELPSGTYASITEAELFNSNYSGMTLQATGSRGLQGVFEDDFKGWTMEGQIQTPWRVTMTGPCLNTLVNCDIVHDVSPPPDKKLFPKGFSTDWIKPGRSLWNWWSGSSVDFEYQKDWVDNAAKLGFEYYLADAGWEQRWDASGKDKWTRLKELAEYGKQKGVGIWVWCRWSEGDTEGHYMDGIETSEKRNAFFKNCSRAGAVGVKVDFMDSESQDRLAFYINTLKDAAKYKLMINFHGANKPTGESRTFPNEITREGLRGLEYNKWSTLPPVHYATLPFTRMLAGHADFTPCTLNPDFLKGTTVVLQLATTIVYTSPLTHWVDKPNLYLSSPAVELIKDIPTVWDETRVLQGSKIGELAAFARRKGNVWYVGIINGGGKKVYELDLSFLGKGEYKAFLVRDQMDNPAAMKVEKAGVNCEKKLAIEMNPGGGFAARFSK